MAIKAQPQKKLSHPICLAKKPVGADAKTRGTPIRLLKRAYCVAVNFLLVILAMKATKAVVPIPLLRFSKAITPDNAATLFPI